MMPGMSYTCGVHWLTAATSSPIEHVEDRLDGLGPIERPGGFGHPWHRVHFPSGAKVYCGSDRQEQPIVINIPGEVCEAWAEPMLAYSVELGAWVTRADFALDLEPADQARRRMFEMRRAFMAGRCETSMRQGPKGSFEERRSYGKGEGFTFYFGGRTADLQIRAYDKRGPLRIETQYRPKRQIGEVLPEMILEKGPAHWWRSTAAACKFPMPWYRELLDAPAQNLPTLPDPTAALDQVLSQLQQQWGQALWALKLLGYTLEDLERVPGALRGSQGAKMMRWADEAQAAGRDGAKLRAEVMRRCRKSK